MVNLTYSDVTRYRLRILFENVWYWVESSDDEESMDEPGSIARFCASSQERDVADVLVQIIRGIRVGTNCDDFPISRSRMLRLMRVFNVEKRVETGIGMMIR